MLRDPSRGVYKRVALRDNRIVGAVLYGDTADGSWYFDLLKKGEDVGDLRDTLIFGQAYPQARRRARPDRRRRRPVEQRRDLRLQRRSQGRDRQRHFRQGARHARRCAPKPKASASCGQCTAKVEALLALALGDGYAAGPAQVDVQVHQLHP